MWLVIAVVAYIILLVFGLLFVRGASAKATPPASDAPHLKLRLNDSEADIPEVTVNSQPKRPRMRLLPLSNKKKAS